MSFKVANKGILKTILQASHRLRDTREATFASFKPYLAEVCSHFQPSKVLEFGPGTSTDVFLQHSNANIISIEESRIWCWKYRWKFRHRPVKVYHKKPGWDLSEINSIGGPYDLIFVDGGNRPRELKYCVDLLAPDGVVFLHDAHREEYADGIRAYPFVFFPERHSCLMCKSPDVKAGLKTILKPDYSCRCQYCNTETRNIYLSEFIEEN